jgi:hypothetical protein
MGFGGAGDEHDPAIVSTPTTTSTASAARCPRGWPGSLMK